MRVLLLVVTFFMFTNQACANDFSIFVGSWSVHPEMTLEYSKKSPKYNPSEDERFEKVMLKMVSAMTIELSADKMTYRRGKGLLKCLLK